MPRRFTLPFLPAGRPQIAVPYHGIKYFGFFSLFFSIFWASRKPSKKPISQNALFSFFLAILVSLCVDFASFWVTKRIPGGYCFVFFPKTAISSKSRCLLKKNTIFEGRTIRKSVRREASNGDPKQKRQKSVPAASPDAIFRSRARFCWILGSRPGPTGWAFGRNPRLGHSAGTYDLGLRPGPTSWAFGRDPRVGPSAGTQQFGPGIPPWRETLFY